MNKPPRAVTAISWIFIVFGSISVIASLLPIFEIVATESTASYKDLGESEVWLALLIRFLGIVSGVLMLLGSNWGRWLMVVWFGYHIILSIFHSPGELLAHVVISVVVIYFLFGRQAAAYFRGGKVVAHKNTA